MNRGLLHSTHGALHPLCAVLGVLFLSAGLAGCPAANGPCGGASCDGDEVCVDARCVKACNNDLECGRTERCVDGACVAAGTGGSSGMVQASSASAVGTSSMNSAGSSSRSASASSTTSSQASSGPAPSSSLVAASSMGASSTADASSLAGASSSVTGASSVAGMSSTGAASSAPSSSQAGASSAMTMASSSSMAGSSSASTPATCGNGRLDPGELCDGTLLNGATCLSLGHLRSNANHPPACVACTAFSTAACGARITTMALVQNALGQARTSAGHDVIALQAGNYPWTARVWVDDPDGVTLRPLDGPVTITATVRPVALSLDNGPSVVEDITFLEAEEAIHIGAAGCEVRRCRFVNTSSPAGDAVHVNGSNARVEDSFFQAATALADADAMDVTDPRGVRIHRNVISGAYINGLLLKGGVSGSQLPRVVNNTVGFPPVAGASGIRLEVAGACLANNAVHRVPVGTAGYGLEVAQALSTAGCPVSLVPGSNSMPVVNPCAGSCAGLCPGPLCDVGALPGTPPEFCPGDDLRDMGRDVGLDVVPGEDRLFNGTAPDVGGRESGTTVTRAGVSSACP